MSEASMRVYEIHHDVPRFAAVMNRAAKLGLAVDPVSKVYVTTDPDQAAQMRRVGGRIVVREEGTGEHSTLRLVR